MALTIAKDFNSVHEYQLFVLLQYIKLYCMYLIFKVSHQVLSKSLKLPSIKGSKGSKSPFVII